MYFSFCACDTRGNHERLATPPGFQLLLSSKFWLRRWLWKSRAIIATQFCAVSSAWKYKDTGHCACASNMAEIMHASSFGCNNRSAATYSSFTGFFNFTMSNAYLTVPYVLWHTGIVAGIITLMSVTFFSAVPAFWMLGKSAGEYTS